MKAFDRVHIELTNVCNLQCSFCPEVDREKQFLDVSPFEHILKQAAPLSNQICLHLMGEPLLHPELDQVFALASKYETQINLTSNGLLLKKKLPIILQAKSLKQMNLSVQAFKDNYPDKEFKYYISDILDSIDEIMEKKPEVYINLRLWNKGAAKSEQENEYFFQTLEDRYNIQIKRDVDVGGIKSKKLFDRLYLHFDSRFDWPSLSYPHQGEKGFCYGLSTHFGIHADGTVVPCCLDKEADINLGNIFTTPLTEILDSDRARVMVAGFKNGVLVEELCKHCSYIRRFDKKINNLKSV